MLARRPERRDVIHICKCQLAGFIGDDNNAESGETVDYRRRQLVGLKDGTSPQHVGLKGETIRGSVGTRRLGHE